MSKPNILVQYQGGGYSGCIWEWNYCLVDRVEEPTQFQDIASSGCGGLKTLDQYLKDTPTSHFHDYDLADDDAWKDFDHNSNPHHVVGVSKWLLENREDIAHLPFCDECGEELDVDDVIMAGFHGEGGIVISADTKRCMMCDENLAWDGDKDFLLEVFNEVNASREELEEGTEVDLSEYSDEEVDQILRYAQDATCVYSEGYGDDRSISREDAEKLAWFVIQNFESIVQNVICQDDRLDLALS